MSSFQLNSAISSGFHLLILGIYREKLGFLCSTSSEPTAPMALTVNEQTASLHPLFNTSAAGPTSVINPVQ